MDERKWRGRGKTIINFQFKIKCSILTSIYMAAILIRIAFLLHLVNCATKFIIIYTRLEWRKNWRKVFKCACSFVFTYTNTLAHTFSYTIHVEFVKNGTNKHFTIPLQQWTHNLQLYMPSGSGRANESEKKGSQQFKVFNEIKLVWHLNAYTLVCMRKMLISLLRIHTWMAAKRERSFEEVHV